LGLNIHSSSITAITLKPLLTLKNMVTLNITSPIHITNATVGDMASAWPKLESLTLRNGGRTCGITLEGLIPLAMRCPSLRYLAIPLNVSSSDNLSTTTMDSQIVRPMALTSIMLYGSAEDDVWGEPVPIAIFLGNLFPNLRDLVPMETSLTRSRLPSPLWFLVQSYLRNEENPLYMVWFSVFYWSASAIDKSLCDFQSDSESWSSMDSDLEDSD
jgi:hypothetical protein